MSMSTADIVSEILSNAQADAQQVVAFEEQGIELAKSLIKANVAPILAIADEAQGLEVVEQITINLTNSLLPFFLKPIEGIVVNKIIYWLDKNVLDKYLGDTWFAKLQAMATDLQTKAGV